MREREKWEEEQARLYDKLADDCDSMARTWASQHSGEGYARASEIMNQKFVYVRMAYHMRKPRLMREEVGHIENEDE